METTFATVSGLVNERQVQELTLNARELVSLGMLYSGVLAPTTSGRITSTTTSSGPIQFGRRVQF